MRFLSLFKLHKFLTRAMGSISLPSLRDSKVSVSVRKDNLIAKPTKSSNKASEKINELRNRLKAAIEKCRRWFLTFGSVMGSFNYANNEIKILSMVNSVGNPFFS